MLEGDAAVPRAGVHLLPAQHPRSRTQRGRDRPVTAASARRRRRVHRQHRRAGVPVRAAYEPTVFEVADDQLHGTLGATLPDVVQAVDRGELTLAAETFCRMLATDDEVASLSASDYLDEAGRYMPVLLAELERDAASDEPGPTDPSRLNRISVPTLLMYGWRRSCATGSAAGSDTSATTCATHTSNGSRMPVTSVRPCIRSRSPKRAPGSSPAPRRPPDRRPPGRARHDRAGEGAGPSPPRVA